MSLSLAITTVALAAATSNGFAYTSTSSPKGMHRSYAQNYKDLVLANCIASAYAYDVFAWSPVYQPAYGRHPDRLVAKGAAPTHDKELQTCSKK
ncbi:hypothetical protein SAMN05444064_102235 [Pseudomonas syringae]|nr:hypothetical protein SAMN05444514_102174 [Pseudomonas syringae]SFL54344.1 hypothetical protein SAMN05444064_102235 [Pseudomonas syringae]